MEEYMLAIDQGTTSTRAILFNRLGENVHQCQREFRQYYPKAGWVEHDPNEIWASVLEVVASIFVETNIKASQIKGIGITNQRETTVIWDKETGQPIYPAIVWQSRQSDQICQDWISKGYDQIIFEKTGLLINSYFSASKIRWILDNVKEAKERQENLLFGTIDSWLIWKLTAGKSHVTDYTNASRTMLYNIYDLSWDQELLKYFNISASMLPTVLPSSGIFGYTDETQISGVHFKAPICGVAGDQQASLFGQTCFDVGDVKNTYGTGCFALMNTGKAAIKSNTGLLTTIAWGLNNQVTYALEGSVFIGGSVIQWLRDEMKLLDNAKESEYYATSVSDNNGVYIVPAFVGLGTPYWDSDARGSVFGLTRGANKNHLIRAALESIAYQSKDVIEVMKKEANVSFKRLAVDGGATSNQFLMQFQSDMLDCEIVCPKVLETTALGAAYLAGLAIGFWKDTKEIKQLHGIDQQYFPTMNEDSRSKLYAGWKKAVEATMVFK